MNDKIEMNSRAPVVMAEERCAPLEAALKALGALPHNTDAEIGNLPGADFLVTQEILINNVCRICATYFEKDLVPLYGTVEPSGKNLAEIANGCLPIKLEQGDGLPEVACASCARALRAWRRMYDACDIAQRALSSHVRWLDKQLVPDHMMHRSLSEIVESVLATFPNTSSMELVCHKCDLKTSSELFYQHLRSKHECVTDNDGVEAFVRDHVTFEEALDSDSDGQSTALKFSSETSEVRQHLGSPICPNSIIYSTCSRLSDHDAILDSIPCSDSTRNKIKLTRDLIKYHPTDPLRCKSCDHLASDTDSLTAHVAHCHTKSDVSLSQVNHETNQKRIPAVCPDCNRTFSNKYNMFNHMKSHSRSSEKFNCECGRSYTTRGNLVAHRRVAHSGQLPHACTECGERFSSRSARDVHSRLHSGARPFSCPICLRSFRAKNSLDKHRETHGPPLYECELCGRRFRRKAHLRYHVGTHRRYN